MPISNLADKAMIVNLSISQWSASKSDKSVNREVAQKHGSDENMGNYRKYLVAREAIKAVSKLIAETRQIHYELTLPWKDNGDRILNSKAYFKYAERMRNQEQAMLAEWEQFCLNYPQFVDEARVKLNGLFDPKDYPSVHEIRGKYQYHLSVEPLPIAEDFRVNLGDEESARIKAQIEQDSTAQLNRAMHDIWDRIKTVLSNLSTRLKMYEQKSDGSVSNPFRDSLITNITELLDVIPLLNITNDATVTQFCDEIRNELTTHKPEDLREDQKLRNDIATRADEILAKMSQFVA